MRSVIFQVSCLVLCTTGALSVGSVTDTEEKQSKYPISNQKGAACVAMAATLGSCLAAVSPVSTLTTMEESDCCASILAFQKAGCHCLPSESLEALAKADRWAYRRRINTLRKVHQRCGWEAFTCPGRSLANSLLGVDVDTKASEEMLTSSEIALWAADQTSITRETSDEAFWETRWVGGSDFRGSQRLLGSSESQEIADIIAQSSTSRDSQITELTEYVRAAVELADAMSRAQDSQVEIQIEMVIESSREEDQPNPMLILGHNCLPKVLARSLAEVWLTLNVWLTLSVLSLVACIIVKFLRRQTSAPSAKSSSGIVSATEEAATFSKASKGEQSLICKL